MPIQPPSWLSWYKKPEYRDIKEYAANVSSGRRPVSPDGRNGGIPSRLRLDRILANKTCSPMSLYDFYMYLQYVEYSAENLEFYMWFKSYEAAYARGLVIENKNYGAIPSAAQSTSSVSQVRSGDSAISIEKHDTEDDDDDNSEAAKETLARISQLISTTALCTSKSACADAARASFSSPQPTNPHQPFTTTTTTSTTTKPTPTTELSTITTLFLLPNAPKELNIPPTLRSEALAALAAAASSNRPASPDVLRPVAEHAYTLLRNCSHRNFVRLGVGNGTFETVCVATVLGWTLLLAGFLLVACRAALPVRGAHARWEVFAAWPLWWLGMSLVLSGLRGSCFFLLLFSRRQRLPWERFDGGGEKRGGSEERGRTGGGGGLRENTTVGGGGFSLWRSVRRLMIFDRRIRVQERHLRRLQRKIVVQSLTGGAIFATLCVVLFIWLPVWRETV
ncbi:uncharacterized protein B0H64DRAFT_465250 [Chaetomium fimeti]|uniref:RGS domain-containing protein n=1 Tax=Chaetomium fimeti TaxID=1854472 RepID=A0AAE0LQ52_9PEZI|nr:hypothetical protein B0H64DRAFT_465250 [Chaetomium fimeti]